MSLLKLRNRLRTVKELNSIFSALQVVTVVRTQKTRQVHSAMVRYLTAIEEVIAGQIKVEPMEKKSLVVISSNRGLCGAFNQMVLAKAEEFLRAHPDAQLVVVGKNGYNLFRQKGIKVLFYDTEVVEKISFKSAADLFKRIYALKSEIYVVYNAFKSTLVQIPTVTELFPVPKELRDRGPKKEYILEPARGVLLEKLFYHYLEASFFRMLLGSYMGELSLRFMVLKGAVDNSCEIIDDLAIGINKTRQANITWDLLEIVTAAEALRSDYE